MTSVLRLGRIGLFVLFAGCLLGGCAGLRFAMVVLVVVRDGLGDFFRRKLACIIGVQDIVGDGSARFGCSHWFSSLIEGKRLHL